MQIREATLMDAKGIAKVHVDSWKFTYKGILSDNILNNLSYSKRTQLWENNIVNETVFIAQNKEGEVIGFSCGGKERTKKYKGYDGELYAIYILKEYQGKGVGKLLTQRVICELKELNINTMIVRVLEGNSACSFYEALGGRRIDITELEIEKEKRNEIVYGWDDIKINI